MFDRAVDQNFTFNGTSWVEFGSTVSHNNTTGLQGGKAGQYYHLTEAQFLSLSGGINADTLDGQNGAYYLDYNNFSNVPDLSGFLTATDLNPYAKLVGGNEFSGNQNILGGVVSSALRINNSGESTLKFNSTSSNTFSRILLSSGGITYIQAGKVGGGESKGGGIMIMSGYFASDLEKFDVRGNAVISGNLNIGNQTSSTFTMSRETFNYIDALGTLTFRTSKLRATALTIAADKKATFEGNIEVKGSLSLGGSDNGYFYSDQSGRTAFTGGDFYIKPGVTNFYLYATNTYLGNNSGNNIKFRGNTVTGDNWGITANGNITTNGTLEVVDNTNLLNNLFLSGDFSMATKIKFNVNNDSLNISDINGDKVFIATPNDGTFSLGDIEGIGGGVILESDNQIFNVIVSQANELTVNNNGVIVGKTLQANSYKSADGSEGISGTFGGLTFKNGILVN